MTDDFPASEIEGEGASIELPAGAHLEDVDPNSLQDINFDDGALLSPVKPRRLTNDGSEDQTNLHLHARHNAQEAIALAKQRAQDFDVQAALERKTNEALRLAKGQAHLRDEDEQTEGAPLVDCTCCALPYQTI